MITLIVLFLTCYRQSLRSISIKLLANYLLIRFPTSGELLADALNTLPVPAVFAKTASIDFATFLGQTNLIDNSDKFESEYYSYNEDVKLNISELIIKYGFPIEIHPVQTEDGYNLKMYRIPSNGSVVFLMHGIFGSADDFVVTGTDSGLAYLLASEGYDVWMGNARGNKHSRKHTYLSPDDAEFWDFSFHEIGYYDLPAMIDYALNTSNTKTLKYIGYSQGTTVFFVMASERPEYNDKIASMVALSPVAYMTNVKSPIIQLVAPQGPFIYNMSKILGIYEFFPDNIFTRWTNFLFRPAGRVYETLCNHLLFLVSGFSLEQFNMTNLPVIMAHKTSSISIKQLIHYAQGVVSRDFRQFDFDSIGNIERYRKSKPPRYLLDRIKTPVMFFYSDEDLLTAPTDVETLYNELNNSVAIHKIPCKYFSHVDFIFNKNFKGLIYERIRKFLILF